MTIARPKKRTLVLSGLAVVLVAAIAGGALLFTAVQSGSASHIQSAPAHSVNQYASKFLCGDIPGGYGPGGLVSDVLAPGTYRTAINIHNANDFTVKIQKKAVVSVQEGNTLPFGQGLPSGRRTEDLAPDASLEVDCTDIMGILNNVNNLNQSPATPSCASALPAPTNFCKGYLVVEAARIYQPVVGGIFVGVPAQLDVTNILTVKEQDGYWKDYTFNLRCLSGVCPTFNDINTGTVYAYANQNYPPGCIVGTSCRSVGPYNLPTRPDLGLYPTLSCYKTAGQPCQVYDADEVIRQSLNQACGFCGIPLQLSMKTEVITSNLAMDSRDISLDFEFVSPKVVRYNCWPKGTAGCP